MIKIIICFFSLFIVFQITSSKYISKNIYISTFLKTPHKYVSKFGMNYGNGKFKFRTRFTKSINDKSDGYQYAQFALHSMMDENWDNVQQTENCKEKEKYSKLSLNINTPTNGEWSEYTDGILSQSARPRVWFFIITDCDNRLSELFDKYKEKQWGNRLQIEMIFMNTDNSHLSFEEQGLLLPFSLILCVFFLIIINNLNLLYKYYKKEEEIDYPLLLVNIALITEFLALLFEILHLWIYESNGKGFFLFNLLNQIFDITSQFLITVIFILVAWGWTINYINLEEFEFFVPLLAFIGILHVLVVGLSRLTDDEFSKNHDYEGFAGYIIIIMRIGLYIYFKMGIVDSYKKARFKIKTFVIQFGVLGTVYFLCFPILIFITSSFVAIYVRHKVIMLGTLLLESIVIIILTRMFTNKGGDYYDASYKGKTLLPNNKFE